MRNHEVTRRQDLLKEDGSLRERDGPGSWCKDMTEAR